MVGLMGVATTGGVAAVVLNIELPPEDALLQTSFVCAADVTEACGPDNAIATFSAEEDRINVRLEEVPAVFKQAVLATEDRDYYEHGGIDPVGIGRALYNDLRGRGVQQGGSTITQQYVKNVYLTSERSIVRKLKEAVLAVKLERELSKDEILERYLNTIYFGRGAYGVAAAHARLLRQGRPGDRAAGGVVPRRPDPLAGWRRRPREPRGSRSTAGHRAHRDGERALHQRRGARGHRGVTDRDGRRRPQGPHRARSRQGQHGGRQHRHQVLRGGRAPPGGGAVRRGHALRRRPPDLHHPRLRHAAGGVGRGHHDAHRRGRPRGGPRRRRPVRPREGDDGRPRLRRRRAEPGPRQDRLRARLGRLRARRGVVVQAVRAGGGHPRGHLAQLQVQRPREDDVPRRPRRRAGQGLGGRQLRGHRAGGARHRRRHPRVVEHRLRPAHDRGRPPERGQPRRAAGHRGGAATGGVAGAGQRRRVPARHGRGLQHLRQPRRPQRPGDDHQDRAGRGRR